MLKSGFHRWAQIGRLREPLTNPTFQAPPAFLKAIEVWRIGRQIEPWTVLGPPSAMMPRGMIENRPVTGLEGGNRTGCQPSLDSGTMASALKGERVP